MTAQDKLNEIHKIIKQGYTVCFTTYLKQIQVNQKSVDSFRESGIELLKVKGESLFIANGKKYECVDGCKITYN